MAKAGFKDYWCKLSKPKNKVGRPPITKEHVDFIKHISADHPDYSGIRISGMLKELFGVEHASSRIDIFLKNHGSAIWPLDFCIQFTFFFARIYIMVIMELENLRIVYIMSTIHPAMNQWLHPFSTSLCTSFSLFNERFGQNGL